ncbi:O-antigen ligase family protein [Microbacterium sp. 18062]|uniref:O-antigen ligase family protein n=1 Tax=Microbacterium sp. 18062 TaxID=2681410 RepID=UPI00359F2BE8
MVAAASLLLVAFFFVLWHKGRGPAASLLLAAGAVSMGSITLLQIAEAEVPRATTATAYLGLQSYYLAFAVALLPLSRASQWWRIPLSLMLLPGVLITISLLRDVTGPHVISGIVNWCFIAVAWGIGMGVARERKLGRLTDRDLLLVVSVLIGVQAIVVCAQLLGWADVQTLEVGDDAVTRFRGLTSHSGQLGKVLFLFLVFVLPLTRSDDRTVRRASTWLVLLGGLLTGLTLSRTNVAAYVAAVGLWLIFSARVKLSQRLGLLILMVLAITPFVGDLLLRQEFDPEGGSRPILMAAAIDQLSRTLWLGVGPNNYIPTVGRTTALTAEGGLPVHSAAMLLLVEIGLICVLLLAIPLIRLIASIVRNLRAPEPAGSVAFAALVLLPGFVLMTGTGWGLAGRIMLPLVFIIFGYVAGMTQSSIPPARQNFAQQVSLGMKDGYLRS